MSPSDWFYNKKNNEGNDLITLGATHLSILRSLVNDLLTTCEYDDTGVTDDLYDKALAAAEILGIAVPPNFDEDEGVAGYHRFHRERDDE